MPESSPNRCQVECQDECQIEHQSIWDKVRSLRLFFWNHSLLGLLCRYYAKSKHAWYKASKKRTLNLVTRGQICDPDSPQFRAEVFEREMLVRKRVLEKYSALRVSNRGEAERFLSSSLKVDNDFELALLDPISLSASRDVGSGFTWHSWQGFFIYPESGPRNYRGTVTSSFIMPCYNFFSTRFAL